MGSAAVRLALAVVAGSVVYALFRQSYGAALLLTPAEVVSRAWLWQPLTYAFVETSPMGVIFAALVLWQVGGSLEQSWGPRRMVSFAVGTTVVAGLLTVALAFFVTPLASLSFGGGWVMGIAVWVAFGLMLGRAGTNFWGLPVSGNVLALIGVGFVFLEGAFYGWLLVVPSVLGLLLAAGYLRLAARRCGGFAFSPGACSAVSAAVPSTSRWWRLTGIRPAVQTATYTEPCIVAAARVCMGPHLHPRREMRNAIAALTLLAFPLSAQASDWVFDSAHTSAQFAVKHMMVSTVRGAFSEVTGSVHLDDTDVTKSSLEATIPVDTVDTREPKRDGHLKSPDFFDVAKFATITFKSTKITAGSRGN